MVRHYKIEAGRVVALDSDEGSAISVFVVPDEGERRYLVDALKVDEHTLGSALDPDELSRLEFEPEHLALIFKRPRSYTATDSFFFKTGSTGLFLFKDRLIVVLAENVPMFDGKLFSKVTGVRDAALRLVNRSVFHFLEHLKAITMMTDSLEHKIRTSRGSKYLLDLFTLEKSLVYYLNAIHANTTLIEKLRNSAAKIGFTTEQLEFLDDMLIENSQCYKQAEIYSNILAGLMDARASIVNNNLNLLMRDLNIITIAIMVPTFVVSAFSMNVSIPLQKFPFAFWIIMGLATVSVLGFILLWRRNGRDLED
ncbi:MAG: magnesium transporter CorA family protein [Myxococcota bacterium]|jgi:magnesium transporter|nr:magnesium transporter CorA family protein [Myxococcota bacterium]